MARRYIVEGPDGRRYIVEGPDDVPLPGAAPARPAASAAQAPVAQPASAPAAPAVGPGPAQAAQGAPAPQQGPQRAGGWGPFAAGVADATIKTALGVRQLFGGLSDEQKAVLRELETEAAADPNGGWRTAGNIAGNVAALAVPGAKAEKAARAVMGAGGLLKSALAAGAGGGLVEGLTSVGEGDTYGAQMADKAKNALTGAVTAAGLTGALGKVAEPFRATADARALMQQGITPTLQQGAEGRFGKFIGGMTAGAVNPRKRQEQEIADRLLSRVTDGNVSVDGGTGRDYAEFARQYVSDQYDAILGNKKFPLSPRALGEAVQAAGEVNSRGQMQREARSAAAAVGNIIGPEDLNKVNRNIGYKAFLDDYLNRLSAAANAEADPEVRRRIFAARDVLIQKVRDKKLTQDELTNILNLDIKHFDVKRMEEASRGISGEKEALNLTKLGQAYSKRRMAGNTTEDELIAPALRVLGETPRQEESRALITALRRLATGTIGVGGVGIASAAGFGLPAALMFGASVASQTKPGARALMGQTDAQQRLARLLREYRVGGITAPIMVNQEYNDAP